MSPTVAAALIAAVGVVISAVVAYLATRTTTRQAAVAVDRTAQIEGEKVDLQRLEWLATEVERQAAQIRTLRADHDTELRALRAEIVEIRSEGDRDRNAMRALHRYTRSLITVLRAHDITPPQPPDGIDIDDD